MKGKTIPRSFLDGMNAFIKMIRRSENRRKQVRKHLLDRFMGMKD